MRRAQPVNVADQPWFQRAVRTQDFATGDHELDPATGKAQLVAALPLLDPGQGGSSSCSPRSTTGGVGSLAVRDMPSDWTVALSDDRGTILARHPDLSRWVGRQPEAPVVSAAVAEKGEGTAGVAGADGVVALVGFAPVSGPTEARRAYLTVGASPPGSVRRCRPSSGRESPHPRLAATVAIVAPGLERSGSSSVAFGSPTRPAGSRRAIWRRAPR